MEKNSHFKFPAKTSSFIFWVILLIATALIHSTFKNIKFAINADEGYYLKYATRIGEKGILEFRNLFKDYVENQQHWLFPNPLRIGFIILSSIWLGIFGYSFLNLAYLSLFSYCILLILSFYFAKKYFNERIATLFLLLLAFSPLNMAMARRALMDSTANLFMFASIWLFWEIIREKKNYKIIIFILIYAYTILVKESSSLLSIFFVSYILVHRKIFNNSIKLIDLLNLTLLPLVIVYIVYITMAGDIQTVLKTIRIIINSPKLNDYAIIFGSGPWFRYLIDFILLSPWVVILSIGFIFYYFILKKYDEINLYFLSLFILTLFMFDFFTKNVRYVMFLDMPMRIFSILILKDFVESRFSKHRFIFLTILISMISVYDCINFNILFLREGIYDPVSFLLLKAKHFVP